MRVITGTAKGRRLETLDGLDTRPTVERVKEGVFSAICFDVEGRSVLDLFAGSGQMGIEALSRGAKSCLFVDRNRQAVATIERNLKNTNLTQNATVLCGDSLSVLSGQHGPFDLVFLDPPYAAELMLPALTLLSDKMAVGGIAVCETDRDTVLPDTVGALTLQRTYRYGRVVIRLYRKEEPNETCDLSR